MYIQPVCTPTMVEQVPPVFLKQLTGDKSIFRELPAKVQRQVWEFDKNLLQQDALPPVGQYKYEVATIMWCDRIQNYDILFFVIMLIVSLAS